MAPKLWQMVISIGIIVGAWLVSLVLTKILQKLFAKTPGKRGRQKQLLDAVAPHEVFSPFGRDLVCDPSCCPACLA